MYVCMYVCIALSLKIANTETTKEHRIDKSTI